MPVLGKLCALLPFPVLLAAKIILGAKARVCGAGRGMNSEPCTGGEGRLLS